MEEVEWEVELEEESSQGVTTIAISDLTTSPIASFTFIVSVGSRASTAFFRPLEGVDSGVGNPIPGFCASFSAFFSESVEATPPTTLLSSNNATN